MSNANARSGRTKAAAALLLVGGLLAGVGGCAATVGSDGGGSGSKVSVGGSFGENPTIKAPKGDAPTELQVKVLSEGTGDTVAKGTMLVANYEGIVWSTGTTFDSSWDRGKPAGFGIGVGQVIAGWDQGLVGQKLGSRVMLTIPPALGYGEQGNGATIPANSTLVFVVDLIDTIDHAAAGKGTAAKPPAGLPKVSGAVGTAPKVDFAGADPAKKSGAVQLLKGTGPKVAATAQLAAGMVQYSWGGPVAYSTWDSAPIGLDPAQLPGLKAAMGSSVTVGSRYLVLIAGADNKDASGKEQPLAIVVDVVGSY